MSICEIKTIGGPCAAESREQVLQSAREAKKRGFDAFRASAKKPRTKPAWDGVGLETAIPWFIEAALEYDIIPATEVVSGQDMEMLINAFDRVGVRKLIGWIGSRNQVHWLQQSIGAAVNGVDWVRIGIKNPMGEDADHWLGAVEHVLHGEGSLGGANKEQLFLIHRGFKPGKRGFRNTPNWELMERVRQESQLPMFVDPSHMAGSVEKAIGITRLIIKRHLQGLMQIDGLMMEIHHNPEEAKTDKSQQFDWQTYDRRLSRWVGNWLES